MRDYDDFWDRADDVYSSEKDENTVESYENNNKEIECLKY